VSAWRVPSVYAAGALAAALVVPRLEVNFLPDFISTLNNSAAIAMYSAIASGMLSLTAIVFSLTFVMVQFSATAYSPRLVLWLSRDPMISHSLGIFVATFLYALAALAWVDRMRPGVPLASVMLVFAFLLASVAAFVGLIQRIAVLQINHLLSFTGEQGRDVIGTLYPPYEPPDATPRSRGWMPPSTQTIIHRGDPQVVQTVQVDDLINLAQRAGAVIEVTAAVGDTLVESMPLLQVRGGRTPIEEADLVKAVELGDERTFEQDPKYAIRILVDIAIRALSPAINDPTTAVQALDQIGDLLVRLAHRRLDIGDARDDRGEIRVVMPVPSWDDFLRLSFDEIRSYGATSVQVMRRMNALVSDLLLIVPPARRPSLVRWQARLSTSIRRNFVEPDEREEAAAADRQGFGVTRPGCAA
jgi:uncharacterized membrane protein